MTWIRKLIRKFYLHKIFAWFILFSLIYPPIIPVAAPIALVLLSEVLQYAIYAAPVVLALIGDLGELPVPIKIPARDFVGSKIFDHLQQSQKLVNAIPLKAASQTVTKAPGAWTAVISKAPEIVGYQASTQNATSGFIDVATKSGSITIPLRAAAISAKIIT